jgi:hypothetical protein
VGRSALAARGCAVATVGLVGSADSRECDAAEALEGKREFIVVGFAVAFAFAVEVLVGLVFFELLVGIKELPRG